MSLVAGFAWGAHVADTIETGFPRTVFVSLGLAVVFGLVSGFVPWDRDDASWSPSRWPGSRFAALALSSLALGLGVTIGFETYR